MCAKVRRVKLTTQVWGSTGTLSKGSHEAEKSGIVFQNRRGGTVIQKKTDRRQHTTKRQKAQRDIFCSCDEAYRQMTDEQKRLFREYATHLNRKHKKKYSCHTWFMKLCMTNKLNEFFEKYLNLTLTDTVEEEDEDKICYTIYISKKDKGGVDENIFIDRGVNRG